VFAQGLTLAVLFAAAAIEGADRVGAKGAEAKAR
jgi:hypothetical protein